MRVVVFWVLLILTASNAGAQDVSFVPSHQSITPDMQPLPVHIGGRVQSLPLVAPFPIGAVSYTHQWPGIYFEAAFSGTSLTLAFTDDANEYRLWVDDAPAVAIAQPGKSTVTVQNLTQGPHRARLEKVTESIWIIGSFDGFYVAPNATPAAPTARAKQIEFIGDSDMTGYGIRSSTRSCTQDEVRLTSDTQNAYPALVAKHFDADYQINAISGRGLVRNYGGIAADHAVQHIYPNQLPDTAAPDAALPNADDKWVPQIIFISLGGNDFSTPVAPTETWATTEALVADYLVSLNRFLTGLHIKNPDAALIMAAFTATILPDSEKTRFAADAQIALAATAKRLGFRSIDFIDMTSLAYESTACDYHASLADHQLRVAFVTDYISQHPRLWSAP